MIDNPLQFAVVREDPRLVIELLRERREDAHALLVASGGDTALAVRGALPSARLTLVEPNAAQRRHVRAKEEAWRAGAEHGSFGVGREGAALCEGGNFEALFRGLRNFVREFVAERAELEAAFHEQGALPRLLERIERSKYWPVAFQLFLSDPLLHAMFGPAATQHAAPGSYPRYFQSAFERGLRRSDAFDNPFLHHVLLGRYVEREAALPEFLRNPPRPLDAAWVEGGFDDVPDFAPFDLVDLSNVPDWLDDAAIARLCARLSAELLPGALVVWRQLNSTADLEARFTGLRFDRDRGESLLAADRSLFYCSLHVGTRIAE